MAVWARNLIAIFCLSFLTACASSGKVDLKVHEITSLASITPGKASFQGLEFLADPIPGQLKNRVNIVYLHGIGWTENSQKEQLANAFLAGIAKAYGLEAEGSIITSLCGQSEEQEGATVPDDHIYIKTPTPTYYETTIPGSRIIMNNLVCMDKQKLDVDDTLEFVVYRVFWDDIFWNTLQFPHVGQDDDQGSSEAFAGLRRKYNRRLKDELVNYGFSDAVMYLGPAGAEIRNAIRGAMCSAVLDAAGHNFVKQGKSISHSDACQLASNTSIKTNQFAFVTESLGSKIAFDVMRESLTDNRDTVLDEMIAGSEFYMLANQIALLSLSDLSLSPKQKPLQFNGTDRPKIIAMSELNDFLTYELVPFYEQLWKYSDHPIGTNTDLGNVEVRKQMVRDIGFDLIDMRLEFADKLISILKGFVDPLQAHSAHAAEPELMLYILCGAVNGTLHKDECLATSHFNDS